MLSRLLSLLIIAVLLFANTSFAIAAEVLDVAPAQTSEEVPVTVGDDISSEDAPAAAEDDISPDDVPADEESGRDVTIHFGAEEGQSIRIHVNPENGGEETDSPAEQDLETDEETGLEKVEAGDLVTISPADGSLLPEKAEANAEILRGRAENTAVKKVEAVAGVEPAAETDGSAGSGAQDSKGETSAGAKTVSDEGSAGAPEVSSVEKTEYRVFEISLDHVDETQYQEGFKVEVSLPQDVRGRDFKLFHIHEGQEPVEIPVETVAAVDHQTGLEVVSGFEFQTDGFSEFVLQYTVDFHYEINGKKFEFSIPGGGFVSLEHLVEVLGIAATDANAAQGSEKTGTDTESGKDSAEKAAGAEEAGTYGQAIKLNEVKVSEAAKKFVEDVESVEFSSPKLVWVGKARRQTTVGALKEANGLACEYSAELTQEQIEAINRSKVESGDWALISVLPFTSEEELTVTMKDGEVFSIKVTDAQITSRFLSDSGKLYEVTVTYEEAANIPDGSTLRVTEFSEGDKEYEYARNSVLADKKAHGELVDLSSFGLAALDISILNPEGEEIEPEAPVQVEINIKELPGVEDLSEVADTLAIQHHVEVEDGVVVETVFDGSTDASFKLETDETVAEEGTAVDPASVSEEDFTSQESYSDNMNKDTDSVGIGVSFQTLAFSTFTITWDDGTATNNTTNYRWRSGSGYNALTYGQVTLHYVDQNGKEISRPSTINNNIDVTNQTGYSVNYSANIQDVFGKEISGYTYQNAHYNSATGDIVTSIQLYKTYYYDRYIVLNNGNTQVSNFRANGSNTSTAHVYLVYSGAGNTVTVHYVDESGNELTISNPSNTYGNLDASSTSPEYLIYDIDGYEYSYTYRNRSENRISPMLAKNTDNRWIYNPVATQYYISTGVLIYEGTELSPGDDIYVVYKKKADIIQGGTPTVKQSGSVAPPVEPRINKESTPNGDDTNTLALSIISDTAKLEVEKLADVIVVFDVSGSMSTKDMGNKTRLKAAQEAVNKLAEQLAEKVNSAGEPLVRMSLIQFSTKASPVIGLTDLTDDGLKKFKEKVGGLTADGGTNWDHALQLANEEDDLDPGRATFVIFVTDGDPTFRNTRMNVTDLDLQGETNDTSLSTYGYLNPNIGYLSDGVYGPGDNDKTGKCYDAAVDQGKAIVSAGKNIYTIGISNDVTKVRTFNSAIHGGGAYLASNVSALQQAFSDIEASITGASGWGNIRMTDGITKLTNTVQKTGLTNVGGDFSYWIAPAPDNWASMTKEQKNAYKPASFIPWNPEAAGAEPAVYNTETGAVEWNMGSTFMPSAGVTYQVRFKAWPSQEAYDYIARLNNGTIAYETLPNDVRAQIIKNGNTYTLKTNEPDAKTTYQSAIRSGDTVTASGETKTLLFPAVEDLNLSVDRMKVQKKWVNDLDPEARWKSEVTLLLTDGSGNLYKSIKLNEDNNYTDEENFISCGLAKIENGELIIYEKGHDFRLTEPEEYAYYWDLDSQIYRPMIINAHLTMLVKTDAPSGMEDQTNYTSEGKTYFKIDGGIYQVISEGDAAAAITATNIRRSNLNLTKKVVDENGNPVISSEKFTFTITINDTKDADIWFSVQTDPNDTTTVVKDLSTNATAELKNGEKTGYYHAASGSQITISIEPGWNLRFTNLPNGTTYTISEDVNEKYTFVNAAIDNGTFSVKEGTTAGSGTINESNKQYTVTYTNQTKTQHVNILKTSQDGATPLPGAVFSLYTERGYQTSPKAASKTGLTSDENGRIDLGGMAYETYYLVETKAPAGYLLLTEPVVITVNSTGVTYNHSDKNLSKSGNGISKETDTFTLTITNDAGYELPETGGEGTRMIYLLGITLMVLAGAGLILVRRRKERAA